jgi:hypothetical protein
MLNVPKTAPRSNNRQTSARSGASSQSEQPECSHAQELADVFPAESILRIILHHGYAVRLSADGERIEHDDAIPVWLCCALTLYQFGILALMRRDFCGNWRGPRECDRGPEGWQQ